MKQAVNRVNENNLVELCWQGGFRGVVGLAKKIGCHRTSVHRAVKYPEEFPDLFETIEKKLIKRPEATNGK
ncbi:MAG TPA: hypothetical protein VN516_00105 [Candidatus Baltobacteraceae bacterium]|nr:hypothetical protein [Candidatus Baltobacteraceae bacterium]